MPPLQQPPSHGIRDWSPAVNAEPVIRIGVVLDEDERSSLQLALAGTTARLQYGDNEIRLSSDAAIVVRRDADALVLDGVAPGSVRVSDCRVIMPNDGGAIPEVGVRVADVVAGRGFHWQKTIAPVLPGVVSLQPGVRGVVLVNEVALETYLAGVITAEMSGACPAALLEAQCICARSWLLALTEPKHIDAPFERCNDDCCQRYQGVGALTPAARAAVIATRGVVLTTADGDVVDANYAKCCGGISETPAAVWGVDKPGLAAVVDAPADDPVQALFPITEANLSAYIAGPAAEKTQSYCSPRIVPPETFGQYLGRVDDTGDYFRWCWHATADELRTALARHCPEMAHIDAVDALQVMRRGVSGRAIELVVRWRNAAGQTQATALNSEYEIRAALHPRFLLSSAFLIDVERDSAGHIAGATFHGAGWGHGAGLCQIGALGMALRGFDATQIVRHYYPATRATRVYP